MVKSKFVSGFGVFLIVAVFVVAVFAGFSTVFGAASSTATTQVTVGNAAPTISGVVLNHGTTMTLTPNATTSFDINYTMTDNNGCGDITRATSTAFRFGSASTCAIPSSTPSSLSCYVYVSRTTSSCNSSISYDATDTVQIWYFANSTNGNSSTFPSDHWEAYAIVGDASNATGSATSSAVEMDVLSAVNVATSSLLYGSLSASSTSAEQPATTTNAGNSTTSIQLYAFATLTSGPNSITTSSQHYASSTGINWGASTALTASAVSLAGVSLKTPTSTTNVSQGIYWTLNVPAGQATGTYNGTNVFSPLWAP
jgi:hypothetical protein